MLATLPLLVMFVTVTAAFLPISTTEPFLTASSFTLTVLLNLTAPLSTRTVPKPVIAELNSFIVAPDSRTNFAPPLIVDASASILSPTTTLSSLLALSVNVFASVLPSLSRALILTFASIVSVGSVTEVDFVVIVFPSAITVTLFAFAAVGIVNLSIVTSFLTVTV